MSFLAFSGATNFFTSIILGAIVLSQKKGSQKNISFIALCLSITVYSIGYFFWQVSGDTVKALNWFYILFEGIIFINIAYLYFAYSIVEEIEKHKFELFLFVILGLLFSYLNFNNFLYSGLESRFGFGYWPIIKPWFNFFICVWLIQCFYGFSILFNRLQKVHGIAKVQIKYFLIAALFGFAGGATNWPLWYKINLAPYFNILISVYECIVAYAIVRYRLMDIRLAISNTAVFIAVYALVLWVPFYLYAIGYKLIALFVMLALATAGPFILFYLQRRVENRLLQEEKRIQDALKKTSIGLTTIRDLRQLLNLIVNVLIKSIGIDHAAVYLLDLDTNSYVLKTSFPIKEYAENILENNFLIKSLKEEKYPIVYEEIKFSSEGTKKENIEANQVVLSMQKLCASVVVPLIGEKELLGFIILGDRPENKIYSAELIGVFSILGNQVALALEIILSIVERDKLLNENFEKSRFESLALLCTGISHQIHNRFNVMYYLLCPPLETFDENKYMNLSKEELIELYKDLGQNVKKAIKEVDEGSKITEAILDYSKSKVEFGLVNFDEAVDKSINFTQIKRSNCKLEVRKEYPKGIFLWAGQAPLQDIISNALDNSWFAMNLKKDHFKDPNYNPLIIIRGSVNKTMFHFEIEDNGMGIKKDDLKKVLDPMFTTKSHKDGTGMGTTVMLQFIQKHGGTISYDSEPEKWTKVRISLPLATEEQKGKGKNV